MSLMRDRVVVQIEPDRERTMLSLEFSMAWEKLAERYSVKLRTLTWFCSCAVTIRCCGFSQDESRCP